MTDVVREECVAVWGDARTAEMEAHCAANGMTLSDFLEAVAIAPDGACDQFGVHVDSISAGRLANDRRRRQRDGARRLRLPRPD